MNKSVVDGLLRNVSPSQINTFKRCNRLWYIEKVVGIKQPQSAAQTEGETIHKQAELYYQQGLAPTTPSLVKAIEEYLPPWTNEELCTEFPRDYDLGILLGDTRLNGRMDLVDLGTDTVYDFKTCRNFRYALHPIDLAKSPQMLTYGYFIASTFNADYVTLRHVYLHKDLPKYKVSDVTLTRAQLDKRFARHVVKPVEWIKQAAQCRDEMQVTPNWAACNDFGGCPHFERCRNQKRATAWDALPDGPGVVTIKSAWDSLPSEKESAAVSTQEDFAVKPVEKHDEELVLFINCVPVKGAQDFKLLEDEIAERSKAVCEQFKVRDVREAPFGQGTAALVATFVDRPLTGVYVATTGGVSSAVVDKLVGVAGVVVRGTA